MARRPTSRDALNAVRRFARSGRSAAALDEIGQALDEAARTLGFSYYALVHHGPIPPRGPGRFDLDNYPADWRERFIGERLHRFDPVQRAAQHTPIGFSWSRLPELVSLTPRQHTLLEAARDHGLGAGFTVPLHQPGEPMASCSFAVRRGRPLPAKRLLEAQLLGQLAFEAARRLTGARRHRGPGLSPRQCDCVLLMAQGKTDWEIGAILGLSEETVTGYLNAARDRYGVARRTQLAIAALFDGEIAFHDVLQR